MLRFSFYTSSFLAVLSNVSISEDRTFHYLAKILFCPQLLLNLFTNYGVFNPAKWTKLQWESITSDNSNIVYLLFDGV